MKTPLSLLLLGALPLVGCGGPDGLGAEPVGELDAAELETAADPLNGACVSRHAWTSFRPQAMLLASASTHVCALTGVRGRFEGDGESVRVSVGGDGNWWLHGTNGQSSASLVGWAVCHKKSCFQANGDARWTSSEITAAEYGGSCDAAYVVQDGWWGDAATFLTGITGKLVGVRETVEVWQTSDPYRASTLAVNSCQRANLRGYARSFFAGTPSAGRAARFHGPGGIGTSYQAGEYAAYSRSGAGPVEMAPTSRAMCVLTKIGGAFRSSADEVYVIPQINANGVEVWTLSAYGNTTEGTHAKARCYLLDQR